METQDYLFLAFKKSAIWEDDKFGSYAQTVQLITALCNDSKPGPPDLTMHNEWDTRKFEVQVQTLGTPQTLNVDVLGASEHFVTNECLEDINDMKGAQVSETFNTELQTMVKEKAVSPMNAFFNAYEQEFATIKEAEGQKQAMGIIEWYSAMLSDHTNSEETGKYRRPWTLARLKKAEEILKLIMKRLFHFESEQFLVTICSKIKEFQRVLLEATEELVKKSEKEVVKQEEQKARFLFNFWRWETISAKASKEIQRGIEEQTARRMESIKKAKDGFDLIKSGLEMVEEAISTGNAANGLLGEWKKKQESLSADIEALQESFERKLADCESNLMMAKVQKKVSEAVVRLVPKTYTSLQATLVGRVELVQGQMHDDAHLLRDLYVMAKGSTVINSERYRALSECNQHSIKALIVEIKSANDSGFDDKVSELTNKRQEKENYIQGLKTAWAEIVHRASWLDLFRMRYNEKLGRKYGIIERATMSKHTYPVVPMRLQDAQPLGIFVEWKDTMAHPPSFVVAGSETSWTISQTWYTHDQESGIDDWAEKVRLGQAILGQADEVCDLTTVMALEMTPHHARLVSRMAGAEIISNTMAALSMNSWLAALNKELASIAEKITSTAAPVTIAATQTAPGVSTADPAILVKGRMNLIVPSAVSISSEQALDMKPSLEQAVAVLLTDVDASAVSVLLYTRDSLSMDVSVQASSEEHAETIGANMVSLRRRHLPLSGLTSAGDSSIKATIDNTELSVIKKAPATVVTGSMVLTVSDGTAALLASNKDVETAVRQAITALLNDATLRASNKDEGRAIEVLLKDINASLSVTLLAASLDSLTLTYSIQCMGALVPQTQLNSDFLATMNQHLTSAGEPSIDSIASTENVITTRTALVTMTVPEAASLASHKDVETALLEAVAEVLQGAGASAVSHGSLASEGSLILEFNCWEDPEITAEQKALLFDCVNDALAEPGTAAASGLQALLFECVNSALIKLGTAAVSDLQVSIKAPITYVTGSMNLMVSDAAKFRASEKVPTSLAEAIAASMDDVNPSAVSVDISTSGGSLTLKFSIQANSAEHANTIANVPAWGGDVHRQMTLCQGMSETQAIVESEKLAKSPSFMRFKGVCSKQQETESVQSTPTEQSTPTVSSTPPRGLLSLSFWK